MMGKSFKRYLLFLQFLLGRQVPGDIARGFDNTANSPVIIPSRWRNQVHM